MTEKSQKELAKLGMDFVIQSILPVNDEALDLLCFEFEELEGADLQFTLGVISGAFHNLLKETRYSEMDEEQLRSKNDESLAQMKFDQIDEFTTTSEYCGKCKTIFRVKGEFENHTCIEKL